jgi:hypothetical protein
MYSTACPKVPRDVMVRTMLTKELFERLADLAEKEERSLSAQTAILIREALDNRGRK